MLFVDEPVCKFISKALFFSGFDPVISSFSRFINCNGRAIKDCDYAESQSLDELSVISQSRYNVDYAIWRHRRSG